MHALYESAAAGVFCAAVRRLTTLLSALAGGRGHRAVWMLARGPGHDTGRHRTDNRPLGSVGIQSGCRWVKASLRPAAGEYIDM